MAEDKKPCLDWIIRDKTIRILDAWIAKVNEDITSYERRVKELEMAENKDLANSYRSAIKNLEKVRDYDEGIRESFAAASWDLVCESQKPEEHGNEE